MKIVEVAKSFIDSDSLYFGVFEESLFKNMDWEFEGNNAEKLILVVGNDNGFMIMPLRYVDIDSYLELTDLLKIQYNKHSVLYLDRAIPIIHSNISYTISNSNVSTLEKVNDILIKDHHPYAKYNVYNNIILIPVSQFNNVNDNNVMLMAKYSKYRNHPLLLIDRAFEGVLNDKDVTIWGISDNEYITVHSEYYDVYLKVKHSINDYYILSGGNNNE